MKMLMIALFVLPGLIAGLFALAVASAGPAAAQVTFSGSGAGPAGQPLSASATFTISGNDLTVVLQNTAPSHLGLDVRTSTLSGMFFDLPGSLALTPWSATIVAGSILQGSTCTTALCTSSQTNVGGEWGYSPNPSTTFSFPGGADRAIFSFGFLSTGLSGNIGNFANNGTTGGLAGVNLDNPNSLNGINFGIISAAAGFNPLSDPDSSEKLSFDPLIKDTVTFVLRGATGLAYSGINSVSFEYGTNESTAINISAAIPEPEIYAMLAAGLGLMGFVARRRKQQLAAA